MISSKTNTHAIITSWSKMRTLISRFDTLDWLAAFFVVANPLYIAYLLIWG